MNIDVDDLGRAVDFYRRAFGLTIGRRFGGSMIEMLGASAPIYLLAKPGGSSPSPRVTGMRQYSRHWTPIHLDFVVPEVEPAVRRAEAAGAKLEDEIRTHAWGRLATMADPFGHGFCLLEFTGRGYDEIADES